MVQPSRLAIYKLLSVVSFLHNNSLHLQSTSMTPSRKFLSFLCTLWEHKLQLSLLYQTPTKLFHGNLWTQIISIGECRWSPISLVKVVFHFVDGSVLCPPSHISDSSTGSSSKSALLFFVGSNRINLFWVYFSPLSLFVDVLHLVVDCHTSQCVWHTLEKALASPSNSRIMQLHDSFQDLRQGDSSVSIYIQQAKSLLTNWLLLVAPYPLKIQSICVSWPS